MKKTILLFFLFTSFFSFAQSYSVLNNAAGEFQDFTSIYDHNELFGYVEVRKMNVDENNRSTIKYIVLDKNFNKLCTGELLEKTSSKKRYKKLVDITYADGFICFDFQEYSKALGQEYLYYFKTYQIVNLKNNTVVSKGIYNPDIKEIDKSYQKKDDIFFVTFSLEDSGFLIRKETYNKKTPPNEQQSFYAVNFKNEKIWEYKTQRHYKKYAINYNMLDYNENYIVLQSFFYKKDKRKLVGIQVLDAKTGKEILYQPLTGKYTLKCDYAYIKEEKVYIGGRFFKKDKKEEYRVDESLGLYQTAIDLKNKTVSRDSYVKYAELKEVKINKYGKVRGEGFLSFKNCSINPDGSFFILAESYWQKKEYRAYTQLYTFLMDKDFNPIKTTEYEVKRTKGSKYSFSQLLPEKLGRAYFFFDKNDDKDLELNILNYYNKSKKEIIQKMPINNDESAIRIFPAKTGYVGIAEYYKNPEKSGKFLEIRLEKINYERE